MTAEFPSEESPNINNVQIIKYNPLLREGDFVLLASRFTTTSEDPVEKIVQPIRLESAVRVFLTTPIIFYKYEDKVIDKRDTLKYLKEQGMDISQDNPMKWSILANVLEFMKYEKWLDEKSDYFNLGSDEYQSMGILPKINVVLKIRDICLRKLKSLGNN